MTYMPSKSKTGKSSIKENKIFGSYEPRVVEHQVRQDTVTRYEAVGKTFKKVKQGSNISS